MSVIKVFRFVLLKALNNDNALILLSDITIIDGYVIGSESARFTYDPHQAKRCLWAYGNCTDLDHPAHLHRLIGIFASTSSRRCLNVMCSLGCSHMPRRHILLSVHLMCNARKGPYAHCGQWRPWLACAFGQANQGIRCPFTDSMYTIVYVEEQRMSRLHEYAISPGPSLSAYGIIAFYLRCA